MQGTTALDNQALLWRAQQGTKATVIPLLECFSYLPRSYAMFVQVYRWIPSGFQQLALPRYFLQFLSPSTEVFKHSLHKITPVLLPEEAFSPKQSKGLLFSSQADHLLFTSHIWKVDQGPPTLQNGLQSYSPQS